MNLFILVVVYIIDQDARQHLCSVSALWSELLTAVIALTGLTHRASSIASFRPSVHTRGAIQHRGDALAVRDLHSFDQSASERV